LPQGEIAARVNLAKLQKYALSEEDYQAWQQKYNSVNPAQRNITKVEVTGSTLG
jgi:hypothetical protein